MSAGIRSGVNWMRLKRRSRTLASVLISRVLARPGHSGDHRVRAHQQGDHDLLDDGILRDDHLAQLLQDLAVSAVQLLHHCRVIDDGLP